MNKDILISVILPVYNGEDHLNECIESVLKQTYSNFEFIIVDDASTDNTPQILKEFALKDSRINIITHKINQKQTVAANTAIKKAQGKYIARMDADDVALPNRFERQLHFMLENPKIGLVGSWVDIIDEEGKILKVWETAQNNGYLQWNLLFGTSFAHSSVMMRKNIVEKVGYYQSPEAEDYDLWSRFSRFSDVANLPEVLQQKRVWSGQLALKVPKETRDCVIKIMQKNINYLIGNDNYDLETIRKIRAVSDKSPIINNSVTISEIRNIILNLYYKYLSCYQLTKHDKKLIDINVFHKLDTLSNWQKSVNTTKALLEYCKLIILFPKHSIQKLLFHNK